MKEMTMNDNRSLCGCHIAVGDVARFQVRKRSEGLLGHLGWQKSMVVVASWSRGGVVVVLCHGRHITSWLWWSSSK
jgi:hypothetical protein